MPDTLRENFKKAFGFDPGVLVGAKRAQVKAIMHCYNYGNGTRFVAVTDSVEEKDDVNPTDS